MKTSLAVANATDRSNVLVSRKLLLKAEMKKLIVGLIAGAVASTAFAQVALQTPADRAKQNEVSSITKQETEGADVSASEAGLAADRDKAMKDQPKPLTTTKQKQAAVASTTMQYFESPNASAWSAGINAAKDKALKGQPKVLTTSKEKQHAVEVTTTHDTEGADMRENAGT